MAKASFGVGMINKDPNKPSVLYWDTSTSKLAEHNPHQRMEAVQHSDLEGKDLSRIKTGFSFTSGPTAGQSTTFYLNDIVFSADAPKAVEKK